MENNMTTLDMVNAALSGDKEGFQAAFDATFGEKVTDALEVKKVEIASALLTPEVETNEVQTDQVEVDGSESSDGSAEVADETSSD